MSDSPNPYAVTETSVDSGNPYLADAGMVNQVTVVGILQIGQGVLELVMGSFLVAMGFFFATAMRMQPPEAQPPPEEFMTWMQGFYWVLGGAVALLAIMRIAAGIGCFWFRGRVWMMISLFGGLLSSFTCYCAPFSIGLCIYGLIVMFNSSVAHAFQLGSQGVPPAEIKRRFAMGDVGPGPSSDQ